MRALSVKSARIFLAAVLTAGMLSQSTTVPVDAVVGALDSPMDLRLSAMEYMLRGDNDHALSLYSTAIEAAIKQYGQGSTFLADLYYEAGSLASRLDLFDKADGYLKAAIKTNPRMSMARMELAELQRRRQKPMDALEQIQEDLSAHPESLVARQQFVRWLALNGGTPQDGSIAHQESLKLLALSTFSRRKPVKEDIGRMLELAKDNARMPRQDKPAEKSPSAESTFSLPTRPPIKNEDELKAEKERSARQKAEKEKAEKEKIRAEAERLAREKIESERQRERERERERALRERRKIQEAAHKVTQPPPKSQKAEPAKKAVEAARPAPEVLPSLPAMPAMQPTFIPPPSNPLPSKRVKTNGFVAPPPPMAFPSIYSGMPPAGQMMVPTQSPPPVKKPKPKPKPAAKVEEAREPAEDKPPPMASPQPESDPEWLLEMGGVEKKKKRGR